MPLELAPLLLLHHVAQRRATQRAVQSTRAARTSAVAALNASPIHIALRAPLQHPAAASAPPHIRLTIPPVSHPIATDSGVKHPTPVEVAQQAIQKTQQEAKQMLAQMMAKQQAYLIAHPRPDVHAQPSDIANWLKAGGLSPRGAFPEWQWQTIRKTSTPGLGALLGNVSSILGTTLEPGESIAQVQLGPNDVVVWYEHPSGAWSYYHHWGQDLGQVLSSIADSIGSAISDAAKAMDTVLKTVQTVASLIPGVGQVVNGIVTAAEAALDALGGMSGLQIALDTAYHAALAAVPGAEALAPLLDPVMGILKGVAGGKSITKAALGQAMQSVPDSPNIGGISPRSVASSLASWLASKVGIHV